MYEIELHMCYCPHLHTDDTNFETPNKFLIDSKGQITIISPPISTSMTFYASEFTIEPTISHEGNI
jgi:hypothetical protein